MLSAAPATSAAFIREHLRAPLLLVRGAGLDDLREIIEVRVAEPPEDILREQRALLARLRTVG